MHCNFSTVWLKIKRITVSLLSGDSARGNVNENFFVIFNARHRGTPPQTASPINAISDFISANYITRLVCRPPRRIYPQRCNNDWYHAEVSFFFFLPSFFLFFYNTQIRKRPGNPLRTFPTERSFYLFAENLVKKSEWFWPSHRFFIREFNNSVSFILLRIVRFFNFTRWYS